MIGSKARSLVTGIGRLAPAAFIVFALILLIPLSGAHPATEQEPSRTAAPPASPSLDALLAKAAEYCRKLESSAFDFVCREEIRETIDPELDIASRGPLNAPGGAHDAPDSPILSYPGPGIAVSWSKKVKRSFVYDYQCVRAGRAIRETRTQLEENGKKKVVPNAELETSIVVWGTALLAPVGIFAERFQPSYVLTAAGEGRIGETKVVIIDAKPTPGAPPTRNLYGKAWIDPSTGDILRIEWSQTRVGYYDLFEKRGALFKRTPRLSIRSEFSAEKNGVRFPSRLFVEEAYLKDSGKAFVRSKTEVVYKDFKFFSVEYEARD